MGPWIWDEALEIQDVVRDLGQNRGGFRMGSRLWNEGKFWEIEL